MLHTPTKTILLVVIYSSKNKMKKSMVLLYFLMEFSSIRWQTILNLVILHVFGRSLIVIYLYQSCLSL